MAFAAEAAAITLAEEPTIRKAGEFKLLGTPLNRLDVLSKVDGSATFGIDVKVPGMVYAAYDACPVGTAALDDARPGPKGRGEVIRVEDGFAVIADSYWRARKGLEALSPQWDLGPNANASSDAMRAEFKSDLDRRGVVAHEEGDAYGSLEGAETVISGLRRALPRPPRHGAKIAPWPSPRTGRCGPAPKIRNQCWALPRKSSAGRRKPSTSIIAS